MRDDTAVYQHQHEFDLNRSNLGQNFDERSDVAQEIINHNPDFLEKWALLICLGLLLMLTASTWFIKYPEIIYAKAVLTGENAPKEIIVRQTGKLDMLFVKNSQQVRKGEILGSMESNADINEVLDLSAILDSCIQMVTHSSSPDFANLLKRRYVHLGEIQPAYQAFFTASQIYNDYQVNGFYARKKEMLHSDIASLQDMQRKTSIQKDFLIKENVLAKRTFEMNQKLFKDKVISEEEYRQAQSVLLAKERATPQMEMNIIAQQTQIRDKQKEIDQLNHDIIQQQQTFEQALQTLKISVDAWLAQYTVQAPTDGTIVFILPLQQNQYLQQGRLIGYIKPTDTKYYAQIKLTQHNFGKVDTGMKVQLRFDAYPYNEVGFVPGTINYLSDVSTDSAFLGTVRLNNSLQTNLDKYIQYKNGLTAQALIITSDMRLLERLYYAVVKFSSATK